MPIGGDLSHNKCDQCNSFLVWNEYGSSRSDESQLEEVCEECDLEKEEV
jgi:RNase P subunit RPR2